MISRFENFAAYIAQANKYILKIKSAGMERFGLKAAHLMCLYFLGKHEEGLTAGELAEYCMEDKAAISKSLSELKNKEFVKTDNGNGTKVYRSKYFLSPKGKDSFAEIKNTILQITELVAEGLSMEEGAILYRSLERVVGNLKAYYSEMDKPEK